MIARQKLFEYKKIYDPVNRVTTCDHISQTYAGEPHDGKPTLLQYTRKVSRRIYNVKK